ncbi:MAG: TPM domain-containing protein [Treponema sp.]|nr:TPM domain-containing protein [Candidatus Treponema merdequi]
MIFSKLKKYIAFFLFVFISGISAFSLSVPELSGPVVDNAKLLNPSDFQMLTTELLSISEQTKKQIVVLTIPSLKGEALEAYSMKVCEKWKIGSKENDDGVLLLIAFEEKKIRIEVGYGLEGQLTDTKCGLIIRQIIAPAFQSGNYSRGILEAVQTIENIIGTDGIQPEIAIREQESGDPVSAIIVLFFMFFYFFVFSGALSRKFKWLSWLPWFSLFQGSSNRRYNSNHHDDFFGGFGGSGGFGGGGFSGGGGGFGGGGASGGW